MAGMAKEFTDATDGKSVALHGKAVCKIVGAGPGSAAGPSGSSNSTESSSSSGLSDSAKLGIGLGVGLGGGALLILAGVGAYCLAKKKREPRLSSKPHGGSAVPPPTSPTL
eukprot:tig00021098_g18170.t1